VDDTDFNLYCLELLLKSFGLTCDIALNGKLALKKILRKRDCACQYQLILLDCNMPILNGYDTCMAIKKLI